MDKATIFLVDDREDLRALIKLNLEDLDQPVALEAGSLQEGLDSVEKAKEIGVNVAILDGSLDYRGDSEDGHVIAEALRKAIPKITIISFSLSPKPITWGDYNIDKFQNNAVNKIVSIIRHL